MLAMTEVYSLEGLGFLKSHVGVSVAMHYKFDKKLSYFLLYLVKKYVYLIIYTK